MNTARASDIVLPIIDFAVRTAKPRTTKRAGKRPEHPDAELIEHCIEYASQIKVAEVGYEIDPTDSDFASFSDTLAQSRATRAMRQIVALKPSTMDGLRAKANIVAMCIDDWNGELQPLQRSFLTSLAEDVIRFQRVSASLHQNDVPVQVPA
jgi:hypothetical protein